ncbi:phenylalanine--tRNA ligase subunit beta [Patescibacteria group bacterium]
MKYSYKWLKELSNTKFTPDELAEKMTEHSFEVEGVEVNDNKLDGVVVGEVLSVEKHPDADRLRVAKVNVGDEELQIVCGAPNLEAGQKVPVALVGTVLPGDFEIKEAAIRGVESRGMICAEDELGLGGDHEGIMVLFQDAQVGNLFSVEVGLVSDSVIDLDILSNRGHDVLSYVGMAREICALDGEKLNYDYNNLSLDEIRNQNENSGKIGVSIENGNACKRYVGVLVEDVEVGESPKWLKEKLSLAGMKSINNIVDATNFVLLELGQPMHAFDADVLGDLNIEVKDAEKGDRIVLLDDSEKELQGEELLITNKEKTLSLAGIMGGKDSGITASTKNILLESANFDYATIRKARMKHGLKTDSSDRFEKEIDPNLAEKGMARILEIISEVAGGNVVDLVDVYSQKVESWKIELNVEYVSNLLGCEVSKDDIVRILESLELNVKDSGEIVEAEVPTFRIDLKTQEDLIEEIGRIYGYDHIEPQDLVANIRSAKIDENVSFENSLKELLVGSGFSEVYNYSFYSEEDAGNIGVSRDMHLELENPMNPNQRLMRLSLVPGLLKNTYENLKNFNQFRLFEIGREYTKDTNSGINEKRRMMGVIVLEKDKKAETFFEAKGYVSGILKRVGESNFYFDDIDKRTANGVWHETRSAQIVDESTGDRIGIVGEINPTLLGKYAIKKRVVSFELDLGRLMEFASPEREYKPISKYPIITRDISMVARGDVRVADILMKIQNTENNLILDVDLFDIFELQEEGKNSFAFHIIFGSKERTLEGKEVDEIMSKVMENLEGELDVEVRK